MERDDDVKGLLYDQIVKLPKDRRKHIVPLGKPGKSGAAVSYWIRCMTGECSFRGWSLVARFYYVTAIINKVAPMGDAWYMQTFCYLTAPLACVMVSVGVYWGREMM